MRYALIFLIGGCSSYSPSDVGHPSSKNVAIDTAEAFCSYLADCFGKDYEACYEAATGSVGQFSVDRCNSQEVKACTQAIDLQGCSITVTYPEVCKKCLTYKE